MGGRTALKGPNPIIIAHRGASGYLPEHTLAAKVLAHAMGADFIEQDVVLSGDGVPVILHDIHLDSTTDVARCFPDRCRADGRFYAMDFSLEELRQLHVHERTTRDGSGAERAVYPARFPVQCALFGIPTLAEEIDLIAGLDRSRGARTGLYIELKAPVWHLREGFDIAAIVLDLLASKGYADRPDQVFLQCFDAATLRRLRGDFATPLPLIQLIGENDWGEDGANDYDRMRTPAGLDAVAEYAQGIGPWLHQIYLGRNPGGDCRLTDLVQQAHARGLLVHPYTFRRDELPAGITGFDELLDLFIGRVGIDGLFTDFPDCVRRYLDRECVAGGGA